MENNVKYLIKVEGTYDFWTNFGGVALADAEYANLEFWGNDWGQPNKENADNERLLDLEINNQETDWGEFSADHTYEISLIGQVESLLFKVVDDNYEDNQGKLIITIRKIQIKNTDLEYFLQ